jgi:hypothetical protein
LSGTRFEAFLGISNYGGRSHEIEKESGEATQRLVDLDVGRLECLQDRHEN